MQVQLNSIISAMFLTSLPTWILKINFCKYSIFSVDIVKSLSFFRCEAIFIIFPRTFLVSSLLQTPLLFISLLPRTDFTDPVFISLIVVVLFGYQDGFQRKDEMRVIQRLIFVILRVNGILATLSIIAAAIITRYNKMMQFYVTSVKHGFTSNVTISTA